jgi:hypothetical protein
MFRTLLIGLACGHTKTHLTVGQVQRRVRWECVAFQTAGTLQAPEAAVLQLRLTSLARNVPSITKQVRPLPYSRGSPHPLKSSPATRHEGACGKSYSSYSYSTSALDGGEWSASRPGRALPPGKGPPIPIVQEAGWAPEPVWTQRLEEKSSAPAGDRTPIARSSSP